MTMIMDYMTVYTCSQLLAIPWVHVSTFLQKCYNQQYLIEFFFYCVIHEELLVELCKAVF